MNGLLIFGLFILILLIIIGNATVRVPPSSTDTGVRTGTAYSIPSGTSSTTRYYPCTEPRPQICTLQYAPVCAYVDNGIRCIRAPCPNIDRKTYGNACTACADPKAYGYENGECE